MNSHLSSILILICFLTCSLKAQNRNFYEDHPITVSEFYTKAAIDTSYIAKINRKYAETWMFIDYQTGDEAYCANRYFYVLKNKIVLH
ncbi:hypothetical protein [Aquimarina agarivorans]|uniref:hypothetical protein n=1 Tax=Aquimarina agarivorans TaxID=980584 RepID=UPI0004976486|nr:hypothetical protein [Aquimarina agarivorans]